MSNPILISELRNKVMSDPLTKAMMTPASRCAVFLDVDGDGPADFGFLCSDLRGDILDTIAIDFTNDGDFDFYIYNCQNPESATYVFYQEGSDIPMMYSPRGEAAQELNGFVAKILDTIRNFDAPAFAQFFKALKGFVVEGFNSKQYEAGKVIYIHELREKLLAGAETKAMIRPAVKSAILLDVDGDGPADFAFLCSDVKGDTLDCIAIDITGEGLFTLYLFNCLDKDRAELVYYPVDVNAPAQIIREGALYETTMAVAAKAIDALYNFDAATFGETFRGLKAQMIAFAKESK